MSTEIKTFGFRKKEKKSILKKTFTSVSYMYVFLLLTFFSLFSVIQDFSKVFSSQWLEIQEIVNSLDDLAVYFHSIDSDLSRFLLSSKSLIDWYKENENIFQQRPGDIQYLTNYIKTNKNQLNLLTNQNYSDFLGFVVEVLAKDYQKDLYKIFGDWQTRKYIIALQNSNEARPNWWFFGSFLILKIKWWQIDYEIIDSYYVNHISPDAKVQAPKWRQQHISSNDIWFVSSNVLGFTDKDWENIKKIYEKAFPEQKIDWVIFLESEMLESLIWQFRQKIWEWQFINTNTDTIRWTDWPGKKDIYKEEVELFLQNNFLILVENFLENFDKILERRYVQAYLPFVSDEFNDFLQKNNLHTSFDDSYWYFWDFNYSYNKIDWFVEKDIKIFSWNEMIEYYNDDIINFSQLDEWKYDIHIWYNLNIPQQYENFIKDLKQKYEINLGVGETHVLNLTYLFENMWMVYLPSDISIENFQWDNQNYKLLNEDKYNILLYWVGWRGNNSYYQVSFEIVNE